MTIANTHFLRTYYVWGEMIKCFAVILSPRSANHPGGGSHPRFTDEISLELLVASVACRRSAAALAVKKTAEGGSRRTPRGQTGSPAIPSGAGRGRDVERQGTEQASEVTLAVDPLLGLSYSSFVLVCQQFEEILGQEVWEGQCCFSTCVREGN